ncbi:hypothetical protein [Aestuariispira insulae]|uniref:Uncharacterized protein n=1 Tax=Aestuariispira insulae TaxID=1461337 RepID=A0A3D9HNB8_9PROT|nr:hypothetical protein [Aestuariispira insulae]RED50984.1 hypothetical protein DFP90_104258 [Aestuariispira insulae]
MANISYRINSIRSIDLQLNESEERVVAVALIEKAIEIWVSQGYSDDTVKQLIDTVFTRYQEGK